MYLLSLFLTAFLIISIISTAWPVKLYHYLILKKLASELNTVPQKKGLLFSSSYAEIVVNYRGKDFQIRFIENGVGSLKPVSGLEIRLWESTGLVMEFYRANRVNRTWGDFQRFITGDNRIDSEWFIITTDLPQAEQLWSTSQIVRILTAPKLEQILINRQEIIIQLKGYPSDEAVLKLLDQLVSCFDR